MRITTSTLNKLAAEGQKLTMVTAYDASFATLLDEAGVEIALVGDSLGMVVQGHDSTLPVDMDAAVYHTTCVARGSKRMLVLGDLPFGSYQESPQKAYANAARLMAAGAHMVKIEGGAIMADTTRFIAERGIPVCGHIGLTPQSMHALGGFKVQGKSDDAAQHLLHAAQALQDAGACMLVIELVPAVVGQQITEALTIPTIGIGAGPGCSGQILNLYDMLGIYPGKPLRFVKNFMHGASSVQDAVVRYVKEVKAGTFPGPEHCF
jgi:3-methyl-2-oxobutanoate hydroxymethyltransferase